MYQSVEYAEFDFAVLTYIGEFIFVLCMETNYDTVNGEVLFINLN